MLSARNILEGDPRTKTLTITQGRNRFSSIQLPWAKIYLMQQQQIGPIVIRNVIRQHLGTSIFSCCCIAFFYPLSKLHSHYIPKESGQHGFFFGRISIVLTFHIINRPGVGGAVLQTPLSLIEWVGDPFISNTFKAPSFPHLKS